MVKPKKIALESAIERHLSRIAKALDRLAPTPPAQLPLDRAAAFVWLAEDRRLHPVDQINRVDIALLRGIDRQRDILLDNTRRFSAGLPANNALLWGARGMGKSSLIKAVHGAIVSEARGKGGRAAKPKTSRGSAAGAAQGPALIEIHREDIATLPALLAALRQHDDRRFILFCDDLSFDQDDTSYKALKALLEGGIEGRPANVVFYATSNRRHLMPRQMIENERSSAINPAEAVDEKVSLSDRFGLWLGFHACDQETFFAMIDGYADHHGLKIGREKLHAEAIEWSMTRGARSGRVAWQFIQDIAGRLGQRLT